MHTCPTSVLVAEWAVSQRVPSSSTNHLWSWIPRLNLRTVAQSLNLQPGHLLHRWFSVNVIGFILGTCALSSGSLPLHPGGNPLSVVANRVPHLKAFKWSRLE